MGVKQKKEVPQTTDPDHEIYGGTEIDEHYAAISREIGYRLIHQLAPPGLFFDLGYDLRYDRAGIVERTGLPPNSSWLDILKYRADTQDRAVVSREDLPEILESGRYMETELSVEERRRRIAGDGDTDAPVGQDDLFILDSMLRVPEAIREEILAFGVPRIHNEHTLVVNSALTPWLENPKVVYFNRTAIFF